MYNLEELSKDDVFRIGIAIVIAICLCMLLLFSCDIARAEDIVWEQEKDTLYLNRGQDNINWDKLVNAVIQVESNGNSNAHNKKSGAIGLMQITPIVLKEWNELYWKKKIAKQTKIYAPFRIEHMTDMKANIDCGTWYLRDRIPQMLKYYHKPITLDNLLISYNAGISYVIKNKPLPRETRQYLKKVKAIYQKGANR